jgi:3-hydroxyisobutyrate dehydrogenase-like beta-hydroxyacid dehydrogenase
MAANLVKGGFTVRGFDFRSASAILLTLRGCNAWHVTSADAMAKLTAAGGSVAASASECVKGADYVITMLPSNATGQLSPFIATAFGCAGARADAICQ